MTVMKKTFKQVHYVAEKEIQWLENLYDTDKTKAIKVLKQFVPLIEEF